MSAARALCAGLALTLAATATRAGDPPLEPGLDPGGTAVAILADGFDYTGSELAKVLARDGEGEAIAWDAVDNDHRPYDAGSRGTAAALAAAAKGGVRIVQVRVDAKDAASLARGIAFAVQTPATIVLALLPGSDATGRDVLTAAARKFETTLFIGSQPALESDDGALSDSVANLVLLEAGEHGIAAAETVATVLGCGRGTIEGSSGAELKRAVLDRLKHPPAADCKQEGGAGKADKP